MERLNLYIKLLALVSHLAYASPVDPVGQYEIISPDYNGTVDGHRESELRLRRTSHRVTQIVAGRAPSGSEALFHLHKRYDVVSDLSAREAAPEPLPLPEPSTATVPAHGVNNDNTYLAPILVEGKRFNVNFDTGSHIFWLYSSTLPASIAGKHHTYAGTFAAPQAAPDDTFQITYGTQDRVSGAVLQDRVQLGALAVAGQDIGRATAVTPHLARHPGDGILGLAAAAPPSYFEPLINTYAFRAYVDKQAFAVTLKRGQPGTFDFGFIDHSQFTGAINYVKAREYRDGAGTWEFAVHEMAIGDAPARAVGRHLALADTGSSLIGLPPALARAYYDDVPGARVAQVTFADGGSGSMWVFPCSVALPSFAVVVNGRRVRVPGGHLVRQKWKHGLCEGNIQVGPQDRFVLGHPFFWSQYVVFYFKWRNAHVGFAQQKGAPTS